MCLGGHGRPQRWWQTFAALLVTWRRPVQRSHRRLDILPVAPTSLDRLGFAAATSVGVPASQGHARVLRPRMARNGAAVQ